MAIELSTTFWSLGVKFLCELQMIEEEPGDDRSCRCGWKNPVRASDKTKQYKKIDTHACHFYLNLS